MLTEADRLSMIKSLGGEAFRVPTSDSPLWAIFEGEFNNPELSGIPVNGELRWLEARLSDRESLGLVEGMKLTRISTGDDVFVRSFEPSQSSGFVVIRIGR